MSGSNVKGKITYIDVDSTYRDRRMFPNPADFVVPCEKSRNKYDIHGAYNILSDSYPYYQWQWGCKGIGSDGTGQSTVVSTITGDSAEGTPLELSLSDALTAPSDASVDSISSNFTATTNDYFTGLNLTFDDHGTTTRTQKSRIISHDAVENVITLSSALSNTSDGTNSFIMKTSDWSITNPSTTTKVFIPGGSSLDGNYVGDYYECLMYGSSDTANPTVHQFRKIIKYNGKTRLATLESALSLFDAGGNGAANKSGTHSTTYLHRLRKGIPILPSGSSAAIGTDNIPLVSGTGASGGVHKISINDGGSGHAVGDVLTLGGGSNARVKVNIVNSGVATNIELVRAGSGYTSGSVSTQSATSGSGTGLKVNILGVGTTISIASANGVSTVNGEYNNKLFYYPAFASGGGTANTDPSAAQDFIPQSNSVSTSSRTGSSYNDSNHCTFPILAHTFTTSGGTANELVIKSLTSAEVAFFVANKEFNILDYKEDGVNSLVNYSYKDPRKLQNNYYEINLLNLILPNSALETGPGGFLGNHSYIMVEFFSESYNKAHVYNTNNPHLEHVMFKCMVVDSANPSTIPFVKFRGAYPVVSNFNLEENVHFKVLMPNGDTFTTVSSDSVPPVIPKKDLQVSATFMLKRIE